MSHWHVSTLRAILREHNWSILATRSTKWVTRTFGDSHFGGHPLTHFVELAAKMYQLYSLRMALWRLKYVGMIYSGNGILILYVCICQYLFDMSVRTSNLLCLMVFQSIHFLSRKPSLTSTWIKFSSITHWSVFHCCLHHWKHVT